MSPDDLPQNFGEWWVEYNETYNYTAGGSEWLVAYAAWHYAQWLLESKQAPAVPSPA